jgi:HD superfamily phosphohydrolase
MSRGRSTTVLDRVYEHVTLPRVVARAADTPWFQRLRGLKQLGVSSFLYPGAVHTRFEHSIGVAHLARTFAETVQRQQPDMGVTVDDVETVMLAGLMHDVGHGPFSHLFEDVVAKKLDRRFDHEVMSIDMMRRALDGVAPGAQIDAVEAIMKGVRPGAPCPPSIAPHKRFLAEIVSNKRCGIDVDKLDYFLRDSMCCFGKTAVDVRLHRFFGAARVMHVDGEALLAFEDKMTVTLRDIWGLRAKLHKSVYQHHVVKTVGHMIGDALLLAEPHLTVHGRRMSECIDSAEHFVHLGDWLVDAVRASDLPAMRPAQAVLLRLQERRLYPIVLSGALQPACRVTDDEVADEVLALVPAADRDAARAAIIVETVKINHGAGQGDPLDSVLFFNPKAGPVVARRLQGVGDPSLFTPQVFEERTLLVLSRHVAATEALRAAAVAWRCARGDATFQRQMAFFNEPAQQL